jgi:microcystin-dependent protein
VTLLQSETPSPSHTLRASAQDGTTRIVTGQLPATGTGLSLYGPQPGSATLNGSGLASADCNQPHNNMMPYLTLNFIIALQGIFPSRN